MKSSKRNIGIVISVITLAIVLWLMRGRLTLNWASLGRQIRDVSGIKVAEAVAAIYACYYLRAVRWRVLLGSKQSATAMALLPSQVIGFAAVALFGRFADLVRPYLVARKLKTPVTTQLAIYSIERAFDLAAAAILFSVTLLFAPKDMPHHEAFARAGVVSLIATLGLAAFAIALRVKGAQVAAICGAIAEKISPSMKENVTAKVLEFSMGLRVVETVSEFAYALVLSVAMWSGIALCYLLSARAFQGEPTLVGFTVSATMLVMVTAMGGSLLQVPVVGWFTQIGVLAAALHGFFGVPLETASACGVVMFATTNLAIIPAGLIVAKIQGIGLRDAARAGAVEAA